MSINDYKLEKQIGSGTFGDVFKGVEISSGLKVAIKRIRKKILYENGKYLLKAYYREIDIMQKCACENSIKFIKEFSTQNNYNIIMELCDTDLLVYLYERPNPFTADEIRDTFLQLNNAFKKMSQNNILHRDLKLGNILIKFTDEKKTKFIPKLSDYGFSKELNNYNYASCTHLGTPATMAPEIMMNSPYNEKSDLWSVGVMMYQLYYREVPYEGNTEVEILQKIKSNYPYKQPKEKDLRDLINKLLVVNVQERLSWNDYFNHPFFVGNKNEEELPYESNNDINLNSINSCTDIGNNFSLSHFGKGIKTGSSNFGYSYSSDIFSDNYCFEGDIYGQKRKMSKSLRDIESSLEKKNNNIKSKVQLFKIGGGINDNEYQFIVKSCIEAQDNISSLLSCANNDQNPISSAIIKDIKSQLKGEWFVFICNEEESNYDFFLPIYKERYIVFKYEQSIFQVYQIE